MVVIMVDMVVIVVDKMVNMVISDDCGGYDGEYCYRMIVKDMMVNMV